ncbi:MAG: type IX secretion system membrane protein PorP/SprF [Flavobacteriaceae bacterium]|nr:type IX secretion system membrane protein PorP/SprF [Flavobacteriaceae bacterium]
MNLKKYCLIVFTALVVQFGSAQEGLPIYSDYLTDNYYLLYPSMAGVANCGKLRLTGRQQWFGDEDAPSLQTLSVNSRIGDSPSGIGAIVFNDKNGYHSQAGAYVTYAHHIMFSRNTIDLNMLSFGLSVGMIQYKLDETEFLDDFEFDPIIAGVEQSATNLNIDFGFSYHLINFYAHGAVRNILKNDGINFNEQGLSYNNLRTYSISAGNVFQRFGSEWSYEPSFMYLYRDGTKESSIDVNMKMHKEMDFGTIWGGLSYRRSLDGAETSTNGTQNLQYFTPIFGVNYKNFVISYTYSYQANSVVFNNGGFHQLTLGYNFNCRRKKYDCNCPSVN